MKINDILFGQQYDNRAVNQQRNPAKVNFKDLLQAEIQPSFENLQTAETTKVVKSPNIPASQRLAGLSLTEKTIETLESFSAALADHRFTTTDLEPFIAALEEETTALLSLKTELPDNDPLTTILDRAAAITYLETVKYRRGDYDA